MVSAGGPGGVHDCINSDHMVTEGFVIVVRDCINSVPMVSTGGPGGVHDCINSDHMVTGGFMIVICDGVSRRTTC